LFIFILVRQTHYSQTLPAILFGQIRPMTRALPSIFVFILTLVACRTDKPKVQDDNLRTVLSYDTTKTALIYWDKRPTYPFDSLQYRPATITQEDIGQIEKHLAESVTEYNNSLSAGHDDYKINLKDRDYKKQLVAVTNSKGEKEVWVNCFCDDWDKAWRTQIVMVHDGGPCYFNFKINLTRKKVYDLMVNGFA
jgi:hypothetical protein